MKRLLIALILCTLFAACKKLDEHDFYLENNCSSCEKSLKKEVLELKGIYYVEYELESGKLSVKYDPKEFKNGVLYDFLQKHHYLNRHDSINSTQAKMLPRCCNK